MKVDRTSFFYIKDKHEDILLAFSQKRLRKNVFFLKIEV